MMMYAKRLSGLAKTPLGAILLAGIIGFGVCCLAEENAGLVARYCFDEGKGDTARNAVAGGSDAKIVSAKYVKAGKGHALSFNGKDNYVRVTDSKVLNITGPNLSVECWFKINDPKATWRGLCGNYHSGSGGYMLVYTSGVVAFYNGAGCVAVSGAAKVADGKWHHAVGVLDNGAMRLYVDGEKQPGIKSGQIVKSSGYPFVIGRYGKGKFFNGQIDDVSVYGKAMTAAEVINRFRKGR